MAERRQGDAVSHKTFTVTGDDLHFRAVLGAGQKVREVICEGEDIEVSDGYHTLREVYRHRMAVFAALLNHIHQSFELNQTYAGQVPPVWKSKHHSDCRPAPHAFGSSPCDVIAPCCSMFEGDFVCGIGFLLGSQITYHLPLEMFDDVRVPELEKAPAYDGHTAADVLERLKRL